MEGNYRKYKMKCFSSNDTSAAAQGGSKYDFLEEKTRAFITELEARGGKPIYTLSVKDARDTLDNLQRESAVAGADVERNVIEIPFRGTGQESPGDRKYDYSIYLYRPRGSDKKKLPVLIYVHGGGFILGGSLTHQRLVSELANGAGIAVAFVNYTPSPEAKFPVPLEQVYGSLVYVAERADALNVDASRLAIGGDSVGGYLATAAAALAKARGGPAISYQLLLYPVTDATMSSKSYREFAGGPWLTLPAMEWFWSAYLERGDQRDNPLISPLSAPVGDLTGMPPALVITDENDVLRDEGEAYAHKLMAAGVETVAVRFLGTFHDFMMLNGLAKTPPTISAIDFTVMSIRKRFRTG